MDKVYREVANKHNVPLSQVKKVCNNIFLQIRRIMADENDQKQIMLHYFGKFKVKSRKLKNK